LFFHSNRRISARGTGTFYKLTREGLAQGRVYAQG
jgi:hypothetical protein